MSTNDKQFPPDCSVQELAQAVVALANAIANQGSQPVSALRDPKIVVRLASSDLLNFAVRGKQSERSRWPCGGSEVSGKANYAVDVELEFNESNDAAIASVDPFGGSMTMSVDLYKITNPGTSIETATHVVQMSPTQGPAGSNKEWYECDNGGSPYANGLYVAVASLLFADTAQGSDTIP